MAVSNNALACSRERLPLADGRQQIVDEIGAMRGSQSGQTGGDILLGEVRIGGKSCGGRIRRRTIAERGRIGAEQRFGTYLGFGLRAELLQVLDRAAVTFLPREDGR